MPWAEFHQPETTGITIPRLFGLGIMVILFRRIPACLIMYRTMTDVVANWKEALFFGHFGPIGVGAIFYVEHTRLHLMPERDAADAGERALLDAIAPVVYWLVLFSIVVHGLSVPGLSLTYKFLGTKRIVDDAISVRRKSVHVPRPANAVEGDSEYFIAFNRFSRPIFPADVPRPVSVAVSVSGAATMGKKEVDEGDEYSESEAELEKREHVVPPGVQWKDQRHTWV